MRIPQPLKSRKLWLAVVAAAVAFGNAMFDWGLTSEQVWSVLAPLLTYIGIEGVADIRERGAHVEDVTVVAEGKQR